MSSSWDASIRAPKLLKIRGPTRQVFPPLTVFLALRRGSLHLVPILAGEALTPGSDPEQPALLEDLLVEVVLPASHRVAIGAVAAGIPVLLRQGAVARIVRERFLRGHARMKMIDPAPLAIERVEMRMNLPLVPMDDRHHAGPAQSLDPLPLVGDRVFQNPEAALAQKRVPPRLRALDGKREDAGVEGARVLAQLALAHRLLLRLRVGVVEALAQARGLLVRGPQLLEVADFARQDLRSLAAAFDVERRAWPPLRLVEYLGGGPAFLAVLSVAALVMNGSGCACGGPGFDMGELISLHGISPCVWCKEEVAPGCAFRAREAAFCCGGSKCRDRLWVLSGRFAPSQYPSALRGPCRGPKAFPRLSRCASGGIWKGAGTEIGPVARTRENHFKCRVFRSSGSRGPTSRSP